MALRYIDSMGDHYTAEQITTKWTSALYAVRDTGLHGYGMRGNLVKALIFGSPTLVMEAHIKRLTSGGTYLFAIGDDGRNGYGSPTGQIGSVCTGTGAIRVDRWGSDPTLDFIAQSAPDLIRQGVWYHLGWRVVLHPSAGSVEVRLNGAPVIQVTGISTVTTLTPTATFWSGMPGYINLGDNGNNCVFDDLVVQDDTPDGITDPRLPSPGSGFTQFLGPVIVAVKRPNAPGLAAAWTPTPSSNANWDNVNDTDSDDDATYNVADASAVGASDLFEMENLLATEDILGAQSLVLARKTDDGIAAIAKLIHNGGVTTPGATIYQPNTYAYMHAPEPTLPDGSLWTAAKWNAIQVGYKRIV